MTQRWRHRTTPYGDSLAIGLKYAVLGIVAAIASACGGGSDAPGDPGPGEPAPSDPSAVLTAPQNVVASAGDREITLSWSAVDGAAAYKVYWATTPGIHPDTAASYQGSASAAAPPYILASLTNGTTYHLIVTATQGSDEGPASTEVAATPQPSAAATSRLNDTGIGWCTDETSINLDCPVAGYAGQDGDEGRDAQARAGSLSKTGAGAGGFDFTKLDADGVALPAGAPAWVCVRDNHTGLVWEAKTNDETALRHFDWTYSWYDEDATTNGGGAGTVAGGACGDTLDAGCDTAAFVAAVNAASLCGLHEWRLPTIEELLSIVHFGRANPPIDVDYFPHTALKAYWSATPLAWLPTHALTVYFDDGRQAYLGKHATLRVRLVHGAD